MTELNLKHMTESEKYLKKYIFYLMDSLTFLTN